MSVKANENVESVETEEVSVETTETVENVESTETDSENTEEALVPEAKSPAETFAAMDEANPAKAMVNLARTQLGTSLAEITKATERIEEGTDSVEKQIEGLIADSEDEAIVELRNDRESLEEQLEQLNADIRAMILESNPDIHPLSPEQKEEIEKSLTTSKANHKSLLTAMEKALAISMPEKDAKFLLSDLAVKVRGGSGSGVAKPRFAEASIREDGTETVTEITGDAAKGGGFNISSGHIAEAISQASGQTAVGNRIKPSEITAALTENGYDGVGSLEFDFKVEGANKQYRIHVKPKSKA